MNSNIKSCIRNPVKDLNSYSDLFNCSVGVCQGEHLSPVLFSLFLNDLEEFLVSNNNNGIDLSNSSNELLPIFRILLLLYTLQKCINDSWTIALNGS